MRRIRVVAAAGAFLLAWAAGACASPLVGVSANTLPRGTFMLDTWVMWRDFTRSYNDNLYEGEGGWLDLPGDYQFTAGTIAPRLLYGVTDWLSIRIGVPIEDRFRDPADGTSQQTNTGLGDLIIDPKMQIFKGESGYPRVALLAGIVLPTGDSSGEPQISDGSTDYIAGAAVTHKISGVLGHACVTYWFNGKDKDGADVNDLWIASASIENPVDEHWTLYWEAKAYLGSESSAYRRFYVCPGLAWNGEHLVFGGSAVISTWGRGGGGASRVDFDWAPYFRIYYKFF